MSTNLELDALKSQSPVDLEQGKRESPVDLQYKLPNLIEKVHDGWVKAFESGTVASAVLSGVAVAIFVHVQEKLKDNKLADEYEQWKSVSLLVFAYMAIIANCSATITSFLLIDKLVEIPLNASRLTTPDEHDGPLNQLFDTFLSWKMWRPLRSYWLFNLSLGILCIFTEFILYLWIIETNAVLKTLVTLISLFGLASFIAYFAGVAHRKLAEVVPENNKM